MAYDPTGLHALSYANGFTLWHYRSADRTEVVECAGYFDPAAPLLRVGDFVFLNVGIPEEPKHLLRVVTANDAARVTVVAPDDIGRSWRDT